MKEYIDKSALVAELNRLIAELVEEGEDTMFEQGRISAFEDVKVFINHTLEVKEVDLKKELDYDDYMNFFEEHPMTQEEKELLLIDLCSRLPYEVILLSSNRKVTYQTDGNTAAELLVEEGWKPYLSPMSSMTEEERKEYWGITSVSNHCAAIDWLNAHHFDYRGLIEKGLALEAPEGMYNKGE